MRTSMWILALVLAIGAILLIAQQRAGERSQTKSSLTSFDSQIEQSRNKMFEEGKRIFRFDTFGDEAFWSGTLRLHQAIAGEKNGGSGPGVSPKTALSVGLKVDADALPPDLVAQIKAGKVDLDDPATTLALLKLNPVVRVTGHFHAQGRLEAMRPDGKDAATLIPPAFGLAGIGNHTWSGSRASIPYWNAYVAVTQMHGQGTFIDRRLDVAANPVASKTKLGETRATPDQVTAKLAALQYYQLSLPAPEPPEGSFDRVAATRGEQLFNGKAKCATCHVPPLFTEPGWNLHTPAEIGVDDFQAKRSPGEQGYRTAPLRVLFAHSKGGFYHDGRFGTLDDVVEHYNSHLNLALTPQEKAVLVEYLK